MKARSALAATVAVSLLAGCASLDTTTTDTNTISLPAASTSQPSTAAAPNVPEPGPFTGNSSENLGTIRVPDNTVLHWSCPDCGASADNPGGDNFQVFNDVGNDPGMIAVNALGQTSGQTVVDGGTYHDVTVNTEGTGWKLTFTQGQ